MKKFNLALFIYQNWDKIHPRTQNRIKDLSYKFGFSNWLFKQLSHGRYLDRHGE